MMSKLIRFYYYSLIITIKNFKEFVVDYNYLPYISNNSIFGCKGLRLFANYLSNEL